MSGRIRFTIALTLVIFMVLTSSCNLVNYFIVRSDSESEPGVTRRSGSINDPVQVTLSLSRAPKLGETTEIVFTTYIHTLFHVDPQSLANSQAWIEFTWANIHGSYSEAEYAVSIPLDEVQVDGDLNWQGAVSEKETIELHSTVNLPREGVWAITGYFTGEGWQKPSSTQIRVAVTKDAAAVVGTKEFYSSPLAYLEHFGYGQAYTLGKPVPYEAMPVLMQLDISKAPRTREEAVLTCHIDSFYDLSDFPAQITFRKRTSGNTTSGVTGDNLLVNGLLNWTGNLKKDEPAQFSATIKFPEEGDWWIHVQSNYPVSGQPGFADDLRLHVSDELSYFGWKDWP